MLMVVIVNVTATLSRLNANQGLAENDRQRRLRSNSIFMHSLPLGVSADGSGREW